MIFLLVKKETTSAHKALYSLMREWQPQHAACSPPVPHAGGREGQSRELKDVGV